MLDQDSAAPIHPGEHLAEILDELGISNAKLAAAIGVAPAIIEKIVGGQSPITGDAALRIGKAFRIPPEFWLRLQCMYELDVARLSTDTDGLTPLAPPVRWRARDVGRETGKSPPSFPRKRESRNVANND